MIELRGARKSFAGHAGRAPVLALDGVDLTVASREFLCILGPSGCGKTTLLKAIMGLVPLDAGTIAIDGAAVVGPRAECAMVFQNFALLPWADVLANVAFGLELRGVARREREERAREWIAAVGLSAFERSYPHQLSGGMQQRVGLARALAVEPRILLMDEPFASLDEQTRRILQDDLLALLERTRKTIVLVTHGIDEALRLGDRVVLMTPHPGRIRESLPVSRSRQAEADLKEYLWGQLLQYAEGGRNLVTNFARAVASLGAGAVVWEAAGRWAGFRFLPPFSAVWRSRSSSRLRVNSRATCSPACSV